jgi:hypothetical protein
MSTHSYEHTYTHPTPMSISEELNRLNLKIHEVGHQERLTVDSSLTKRIINYKYNTNIKYKI